MALSLLMLPVVVGSGNAGAAAAFDLIAGHDWSHLVGASPIANGIQITGLGRAIVKQNGTGGQPNPPVNARGPLLHTDGDFKVSATFSGFGAAAYVHLYDEAPVIYDEWRQEPAGVRIGVVGGRVEVSVWDGHADAPTTVKRFGSGISGTVTLTLDSLGYTFHVYAGGTKLGTVADPGVFGSGTIRFGADAAVGTTFTLAALRAEARSGDPLRVTDAPGLAVPVLGESLRRRPAALLRPIAMGTALNTYPLFADQAYREVAGGQHSMFTPENDFKAQFLQPQRGVFAFPDGDSLVAFASANGMAVHGHTLVWHEAMPSWMRSVSAAEIQQVMVGHISTVVGHYRGQVAEWDVVNEPMSDEDEDYTNGRLGLRYDQSPWAQALGEQYIDLAFQAAHAADPNAVLYLNEYGAEADGERWDALYALVSRLKARGVPIHGVGFQNHEYEPADYVDPEVFRAHVRALAGLGMKVRVSEMDVLVGPGPQEATSQANEFAGKLRVCRQEPNCTSFTTWGHTDRYGSTGDAGEYPPAPSLALPWNANLAPRKAYTSMLSVLA